jgi:hypothetical protein
MGETTMCELCDYCKTAICEACWLKLDKWLPMETAPKDGERVLLKEDGTVYIGWYAGELGEWDADGGEVLFAPEGWRPLPEV